MKPLPGDPDAERVVLGSVILDPEVALPIVSEVLRPGDFSRPVHGRLYELLLDMWARGLPIEVLSVAAEVKTKFDLNPLELQEMVDEVVAASSVGRYAAVVRDHAIRRRLMRAGQDLVEAAASGRPIDEVLDEAEGNLYSARTHLDSTDVVEIGASVSGLLDQLEKIHEHGGRMPGLSTGLVDLDRLLGGLQPGQLVLLAARPSVGKSALATQIARHVAATGTRVMLWSVEMSHTEISSRLLCAEAEVSWVQARDGRLALADWQALAAAADRLQGLPLTIVDSGSASLLDVRSGVRRARDVGLVIIDYLQLMHHHRQVDSRVAEVSEISRGLKLLAKELHLPVIALSQLNRALETRSDRRPRLSDLRESGALEQDADIVLFLHRDDPQPGLQPVEVVVAKHRQGPTGSFRLLWDPRTMRFLQAHEEGPRR
jgi:replicative DNA helicase